MAIRRDVLEEAEAVKSAYQTRISNGVTIPTWLFAGIIGAVAGLILGPAIMASTATGSAKLASLSKQYIEKGR